MNNETKLVTKKDLVDFFTKLGIKPGMIVEVHASLKNIGYICGGAETFNDALIEVLGYGGTIIMPMHCAENTDPTYFENPAISFEDMNRYRANMPVFDAFKSETYMMSKIVDNLRRREKSVVSEHPNVAFVALGKYAKLLCNHQNLDFGLGEESPLGRLYGLKAHCLLVGVDYDSMTSMHLAEYKTEIRPIIMNGAAILENGHRHWSKYLDFDLNSDDGFNEIGKHLEDKKLVQIDYLNEAKCRLLRIDTAVDEGIKYYRERVKL